MVIIMTMNGREIELDENGLQAIAAIVQKGEKN